MIRIQILKNNIVTNQADFKTVQLATEWLDSQKAKNTFGRNQREKLAKQDAQGNYFVPGEDINQSISFRDTIEGRYYTFPADYSVISEDVTAEYQQRKDNENEKETIKNSITQLRIDIGNANTVQQLKTVIDKILRLIQLGG